MLSKINIWILVAIALVATVAVIPTDARACASFDWKAEIAAVQKALPKAKLSADDRAKIKKMLIEARKQNGSVEIAMHMLALPRIQKIGSGSNPTRC